MTEERRTLEGGSGVPSDMAGGKRSGTDRVWTHGLGFRSFLVHQEEASELALCRKIASQEQERFLQYMLRPPEDATLPPSQAMVSVHRGALTGQLFAAVAFRVRMHTLWMCRSRGSHTLRPPLPHPVRCDIELKSIIT